MSTEANSTQIIGLAQGHLAILISRNWPAIEELLDESEEVTVSAKIVITERTPKAGEHGDVDHRVKTTISFSKKVSDSTESALEDPSSPPLKCDHGKTLDEYCQECSDEGKASHRIVFVPPPEPEIPPGESMSDMEERERGERFPETGDNDKERQDAREAVEHAAQPIGTSLATKLAEAAQGKTLAPVVIDFPEGFTGDKYRALWRKAAKKHGWPFACIDLIADLAVRCSDDRANTDEGVAANAKRVLDVLKAHSMTKEEHHHAEQAQTQFPQQDEAARLAGTFGETE